MSSEVSEVKQQNIQIQKSFVEIEKSVDFLAKKYDETTERIELLERERKDQSIHIKNLEDKIEDLQRNFKLTSLEIRNVPEKEKESQQDLTHLVKKTCNTLKLELNSSDLRDAYRIKTKAGKNTVIADFASVQLKNNIIKNVKAYNKGNPSNKLNSTTLGLDGNSTPIYIGENLTDRGRRLYYHARETAKALNYKYCWTSNGRIFMRKSDGEPHIMVKNESQLQSIQKTD